MPVFHISLRWFANLSVLGSIISSKDKGASMKKIVKATLLLLSLGPGTLYAKLQGQARIDSLLKELPKQKQDTNKVNILSALSIEYCFLNPDEGIKYGQMELKLALELHWKKGIAWANHNVAQNYRFQTNYPKSLEHYYYAMRIFEELHDTVGLSHETYSAGTIYIFIGDADKALELYLKALKLARESRQVSTMVDAMCGISDIYLAKKDYSKALDILTNALKLCEETGDKTQAGNVAFGFAELYGVKGDRENEIKYYQIAFKCYEQVGDKFNMTNVLNCIAITYVNQKQYEEALVYHLRLLKLEQEDGEGNGTAVAWGSIGEDYLGLALQHANRSMAKIAQPADLSDSLLPKGKIALLHKAKEYTNKSIEINLKIGKVDNLTNGYYNLFIIDSMLTDCKGALDAFIQFTVYKDSVFSKDNSIKIARLEVREKQQKDSLTAEQGRKLAELKFRQQRNYTYIGATVIMGLLVFSFFIVKERRKSDKLLLNILPAEVANELRNKGSSAARHFDNVTVLFTDFVGFTTASERMTPQELVNELHVCFQAFDGIVGKYNIEKIKTVGDAYLAVAGLPIADPNHAKNIVEAAIKINAFIQDRVAKMGNKTFPIRIGIHSGSVVAGIVGVKKFAYDIWGDTVNTAARMEQNSEPGKINISQTTYDLVKDKFSFEYRGEIDAKGKGMMKMYYMG